MLLSAITHAARFLADLKQRFGNVGLAAAAYNAGPGRLAKWLQGAGALPDETRLYVQLVTGRPVDQWIGSSNNNQSAAGAQQSCAAAITEFRQNAHLRWRSGLMAYSPLFRVTPDGRFVRRHSTQDVTVMDRLAVHDLLARAVGASLRR
jgi:hypothetical protein